MSTADRGGIDELLVLQKRLMDEVPHELKGTAALRMVAGSKLMETLFQYLNSTGHKPWRPTPLSEKVQQKYLYELKARVFAMGSVHENDMFDWVSFSDDARHFFRQLVSGFGIIEETLEHLASLTGGTRSERLEELTDILFFYLEQVLLSEFTWDEVEAEYRRKWEVNMDRYRRAKQGDYSWDRREEGRL